MAGLFGYYSLEVVNNPFLPRGLTKYEKTNWKLFYSLPFPKMELGGMGLTSLKKNHRDNAIKPRILNAFFCNFGWRRNPYLWPILWYEHDMGCISLQAIPCYISDRILFSDHQAFLSVKVLTWWMLLGFIWYLGHVVWVKSDLQCQWGIENNHLFVIW